MFHHFLIARKHILHALPSIIAPMNLHRASCCLSCSLVEVARTVAAAALVPLVAVVVVVAGAWA